MNHSVYFAYGKHLHRRYGQQLTRRDLFIYENLRRITGHQHDDPTFAGIVPAMIRMIADAHDLWPIVQYQTDHNKDVLLQQAKERGVVAWLLTKLAPNGKTWDEVGLHPAMFFLPGRAYEAMENQDGEATMMAIQLRPGWQRMLTYEEVTILTTISGWGPVPRERVGMQAHRLVARGYIRMAYFTDGPRYGQERGYIITARGRAALVRHHRGMQS